MHTLANRVLYGLLDSSLRGLTRLPRRMAYWMGPRFGDLAYALLAERRGVTLQNLALAFGEEKTPQERKRIARAVFRNLGRHLVDFAHLRRLTAERFAQVCTIEGLDRVRELLSHGNGLLVLSAHFGSWELVPASALSLDIPLQVIVRPPDHPVLRRLAEVYRRCCGYRSIPKQQALAESVHALRRGAMVAVLMDQSSLRREAVEVEFFGIKAFTSVGPALIALRSRCPVVSAFLVREPQPGRHRLIISDEIPVIRTGHLRRDIEDNTRRFNRIIETYVRRYPDHWFWLHRRWKQRPEPSPS